MADQLGELFVKITADMDSLKQSLGEVEGEVKKFDSKVGGFLKAGAIAAAGVIIAKQFGKMLTEAAQFGQEIDLMADKMGMATDEIQMFNYATQMTGTSLNTFSRALSQMNEVIANAASGNEAAIKLLEGIGLTISDLLAMTPAERFEAIAQGIASIEDPALRSAAATKILGQSGDDLLPLMNNLDELKAKWEASGLKLSEADIQSLKDGAVAAEQLGLKWELLKAKFAATVWPSLQPLIDGLSQVIGLIGQIINWFSELDTKTKGISSKAMTGIFPPLGLVGGTPPTAGANVAGDTYNLSIGNYWGDEQSKRELVRELDRLSAEEGRRSFDGNTETGYYAVGGHA